MAGVSIYRHGGVVIMTDTMKITVEDSGAPEGFDLRHERMGGRNSFFFAERHRFSGVAFCHHTEKRARPSLITIDVQALRCSYCMAHEGRKAERSLSLELLYSLPVMIQHMVSRLRSSKRLAASNPICKV